eukprot:11171203-Lingulodinium_polyedra.AAC.1
MAVAADVARPLFSRGTTVPPSVATADATDICSISSVVSTGGAGTDNTRRGTWQGAGRRNRPCCQKR